jgi:hypothetical protein
MFDDEGKGVDMFVERRLMKEERFVLTSCAMELIPVDRCPGATVIGDD